MGIPLPLKPWVVAIALLGTATSVIGAPSPSADDLQQMLVTLNQRMERLEQRNAELERELHAIRVVPTSATTEIEKRVQTLETQQATTMESLQSDTLSENEPELSARLKAVEMQAQSAQSAARKIEALEGISAGVSISTVMQNPIDLPDTDSQLNYRGDAFVTLPLENIGDTEQRLFAQFRIGQGSGLNNLSSFSKPNATAFRVLGGLRPDDSVAVLGQAWYQASIPLPFGGHNPSSKELLEITFGKIDPFVFFDQNTAANDETRQFVNTIFVHNPLLDAGGDIGVDANGFSPGFRLSYSNFTNKPKNWRVSLGVFGAGVEGSNYQRSLSSPLIILQAETEQRLLGGLAGTYRIYTWRNAQAGYFDPSVDMVESHSGWGISADQRVGDGITLFGRFGQQMQGRVSFDQALTVGAEINGAYWNRGGDSLGLAAGWLNTSQDYRDYNAVVIPNSGNERVAEFYYRYRISKQFELSPSFQYIDNPASDSSVDAIKILGLRAQITY